MATGKPASTMPFESAVAVLTEKVDNLLVDAGERREQMTELVRAVNKLAVIEERQSTDRAALERAFDAISKHGLRLDQCNDAMDKRVKKLEESDPINKLSSGAVMKVMWLVIAAFVGANISGLLQKSPPAAMIQVAPSAPTQPAQANSQPLNP